MNEYPYWWDTIGEASPTLPPSPAAPATAGQAQPPAFASSARYGGASPVPSLQPPAFASSARYGGASPVPSSADVAIVGAGYTGLAAARQLARAGADVVVLEREHVGFGASSRNGGQVLTGMKVEAATLVARYGEMRARQLFDVAGQSIARLEALVREEGIDCEYRRVGHIEAAWKPRHFDAFREEQALLARVFAHRVELVSRSEQRSEIGTDAYHGLLVDERSGSLNPAQYVQGLSQAAVRAGVTLMPGTAVTGVSKRGDRWHVETSRGELQAQDVLLRHQRLLGRRGAGSSAAVHSD